MENVKFILGFAAVLVLSINVFTGCDVSDPGGNYTAATTEVVDCTKNSDCTVAGTVCDADTNKCVTTNACSDDESCNDGMICETTCRVGCRTNGDCLGDQVCSSTALICVDPVSNCPSGERCCESVADCLGGEVCLSGTCQDDNSGPCTSNGDCLGAEQCTAGQCVVPATSCPTTPCGSSQICVGNSCVNVECTASDPCPAGQSCVGNSCHDDSTPQCQDDNGCSGSQVCESQVCVDPTPVGECKDVEVTVYFSGLPSAYSHVRLHGSFTRELSQLGNDGYRDDIATGTTGSGSITYTACIAGDPQVFRGNGGFCTSANKSDCDFENNSFSLGHDNDVDGSADRIDGGNEHDNQYITGWTVKVDGNTLNRTFHWSPSFCADGNGAVCGSSKVWY